MTFNPKILLILGLFISAAHAQAGTIVSAKKCLTGGRYPGDCINIAKPSDRSCSVKTTSTSKARIGESKFSGKFSFPGLKVNKKFNGFIVAYYTGVDGIVRQHQAFGKGKMIGEWSGSLKRHSSGESTVLIKDFYYYAKSSAPGYYVEYHCKL